MGCLLAMLCTAAAAAAAYLKLLAASSDVGQVVYKRKVFILQRDESSAEGAVAWHAGVQHGARTAPLLVLCVQHATHVFLLTESSTVMNCFMKRARCWFPQTMLCSVTQRCGLMCCIFTLFHVYMDVLRGCPCLHPETVPDRGLAVGGLFFFLQKISTIK